MAAAVGTLTGCVVVPADRYYDGYYGGAVTTAPPGEVAEVVTVAPGPGYFWIGGYWNWVGHRHVWVGGHWQAHRPGYHWQAHRWHRDRSGWRAAPGHWQRR
ncbi:hypothetical protein [Aquabacterium sp.]|uniref:hypothetical protein n=1 Tax=Aquabacterium sp. TaxID=1872578 RepID=UPI002B5F6BD1|nr:hypothetical protein [Aquabacterium sp.]HSW08479.1 hypothetical protein [Aquabacterium sp.]